MESLVQIIDLLLKNTVPILTALTSLVAAVGAVAAVVKGRENSTRLVDVQASAAVAAVRSDEAAQHAETLHKVVNSRMDALIAAVRAEAARAIDDVQKDAVAKVDALREELRRERSNQ